jgi:hypothetical protein
MMLASWPGFAGSSERVDPAMNDLPGLLQLCLRGAPATIGMLAPVTPLLKWLSVRKRPKSLPLGLRNPQGHTSALLSAKMLGQSVADLVQVDQFIRRI